MDQDDHGARHYTAGEVLHAGFVYVGKDGKLYNCQPGNGPSPNDPNQSDGALLDVKPATDGQ